MKAKEKEVYSQPGQRPGCDADGVLLVEALGGVETGAHPSWIWEHLYSMLAHIFLVSSGGDSTFGAQSSIERNSLSSVVKTCGITQT